MLQLARQRVGGTVLHGDTTALPLADDAVDVAVAMTRLEFADAAESLVGELDRATRRGGRIALGALNPRSPWGLARRRELRRPRGPEPSCAPLRSCGPCSPAMAPFAPGRRSTPSGRYPACDDSVRCSSASDGPYRASVPSSSRCSASRRPDTNTSRLPEMGDGRLEPSVHRTWDLDRSTVEQQSMDRPLALEFGGATRAGSDVRAGTDVLLRAEFASDERPQRPGISVFRRKHRHDLRSLCGGAGPRPSPVGEDVTERRLIA